MAVAMSEPKNETALARFEDVRKLMADYPPDKFLRLMPTVYQERSDLYRPAAVPIPIDPDDARDVYPTPGAKDGTVCLKGRKLAQIGGALGIKWLRTELERDADNHSVTATVFAEWTDGVGDRIPLTASATEYLEAKPGRTVSSYPEERAETRAMSRVVRKLTGMPSSYSKDELRAKSFIGLRWRLDERVPEVRDALIKAGTNAAATVFGANAAPWKAINAGHEGPDEQVQEGTFTEQPAPAPSTDPEPAIPDEPKPDTAPDTSGIQTVVAQIIGRTPRTGGAAQASTDEQQAAVGIAFRDTLGLKGLLSPHAMNAVRLGIARFIYGGDVKSVRDLTIGQAKTLAAMPPGELAAVYNFWLDADPKAEIVRDEIAAKGGR